MLKTSHACCLIFAALLMTSCGGDTGGTSKITHQVGLTPDTVAPVILVDAMGLEGTLSENATVTVNGVADQDGLNDANYSVEINMGTNGLPNDPPPGGSALGSLVLDAMDGAGNTGGQQVDFNLMH